ncbi:MAG: class I SAM-dependent methyltransferase [Nitrospirota bacterium]
MISQRNSPRHILYDSVYFDRQQQFGSKKGYKEEADQIIHGLQITEKDLVLDIGCCTGIAQQYIKDKTGCRIVPLDFPLIGLKMFYNPIRVNADAHHLPFKDTTFDKIYTLHTIGHVYSPSYVLKEIQRVLKPMGKLGLVTPNSWYVYAMRPLNILRIIRYNPDPTRIRCYSANSLKREIESAGFEIIDLYTYGELPNLFQFLSPVSLSPQGRGKGEGVRGKLRSRIFAFAVKR